MRPALLLLLVLVLSVVPLPPALAQAPIPAASADSAAPGRRLATMPVVGEAMLLGRAVAHTTTAPLRWGSDELTTLGLGVGGVALPPPWTRRAGT